ncbi:MAG: polysaccharide biosynthesis protein [Hyphomonadaceae bacterium]
MLAGAAEAGERVVVAAREGVRPLRLDDLLGAPESSVDWARVRSAIEGRRVLVTGGAGSIGGELARKLATLGPARLSIFDNSEFNLSQIAQDLPLAPEALALRYGCIRDAEAVKRFFTREKPDIVFHAAAMKHVPIVEANPSEGALTNVLGSRNILEAAARIGAHVVFVSTDKAANPLSVMGATKRLIELYCQAIDREAGEGAPRRLVARLGNVLGSAGSVTPLFERQLDAGGPLTVTDPDVVRYFITIRQAADFLLHAAAVAMDAKERGVAHILDMGEPVPIVDVARDMIRLRGLAPDRDVAIKFVGLRPGEKLREEMTGDDEIEEAIVAPGVAAVRSPAVARAVLEAQIERIVAAARMGADDAVRRLTLDAAAPAGAERALA